MLRIILGLMITFYLSSIAFAKDELVVRTSKFPPLYYEENGKWKGYDVELAKLLITEAGMKPIFKYYPWKRALDSLKDGTVQVMMNLSITPERSEFLYWIGPERFSKTNLIVKKGMESKQIKSLEDMVNVCLSEKKAFGYLTGAQYSKEFHEKLASGGNYKKCFTEIAKGQFNIEKTVGGRILGFFEEPVVMDYKIKNEKDYEELAVHSYTIVSESVYFGVSKKGVDIATLKKLKEAYARLINNGSFKKVWDNYQNF